MEQENDRFLLSEQKLQTIQDLLKENQRDVPAFTDEGICEEFYVPVKDGELRVFHHKPEKIEVKPLVIDEFKEVDLLDMAKKPEGETISSKKDPIPVEPKKTDE